ncbi:nuclear transport factor 2 family protein [Kribbella deserti]|uniref:Nuclear transport factor 2 family protein n=1 Tax=Kribbella deserti TaxID=1926257 RepID=A0ABV6QDU8_9ACTN
MTGTDAKSVAIRYVDSWTTGDLETTRSLLHDDVRFVGPLGTAEGIADCLKGLEGLVKVVKSADRKHAFADGDDACVIYDLNTEGATLPTSGWFKVRDGRISAIRVFFDPRPLFG